ncbi:hypothetical protein BpHYR1_000763 [Brachionus plicatilis]|uniref:Uncharacterized protein n=1 Tax=Brachionus plicatilis TaxID=10195 RepID=A0A3M7RT97_BRAPC|nr:hypothetical protein BpHYR1_000763 [Brachionus plicatilis]
MYRLEYQEIWSLHSPLKKRKKTWIIKLTSKIIGTISSFMLIFKDIFQKANKKSSYNENNLEMLSNNLELYYSQIHKSYK